MIFAFVSQKWQKHAFVAYSEDEGEGEVAVFSAKCWSRMDKENLIPCHDAQVVGLYMESNPVRPPDCYDCKVKGLHHCDTTPSTLSFQSAEHFLPATQLIRNVTVYGL